MIETILECAAYTAKDNPEEEKNHADRVNFHAVKNYVDLVYHRGIAGEVYNIGSCYDLTIIISAKPLVKCWRSFCQRKAAFILVRYPMLKIGPVKTAGMQPSL